MPMSRASLNLVKVTAGTGVAYVAEGVVPAVSQPVIGRLSLSLKRMMAYVPIANDLLRYSTPAADDLVARDAAAVVAAEEN
jgi:HK97 family phage major capsid protein